MLLAALPVARAADADDEAARVVVVANERDAESVALARYYMAARGIPSENLIALPMPSTEAINWDEFITQILDPLRARLSSTGWLEGIMSERRDEFGRRKFVCTENRISYLVLCRGVPLKIGQNPEWLAAAAKTIREPGTVSNSASVDSELSTMAMGNTSLNGQIPNPLFRLEAGRLIVPAPVVRVARLDGPTPKLARDLVDNAIAAERTGLAGRAYVDLSGWNPMGDGWLERIASFLDAAGVDVDIDRERPTMPASARFDAPALYFGWYDWNLSGPMAIPGFRFPPGAIAVHIQSYSAETLHSETKNWCGPLIARGATATLGNVHEPYLGFTHRLDMFLEALFEGRTFGDAGYFSTPVLSWQAVLVGDPLYRPFAKSFEVQWENRKDFPPAVQTALASRKVRLLLRAEAKDEALRIAREQFRDAPSMSSGLLLAETSAAVEGPESAPQHLHFIAMLDRIEPLEIGVTLDAARKLTSWGAHAEAFEIYKRVLAPPVPAWADEAALIDAALGEARLAGVTDGVVELEARLGSLRTPAASATGGDQRESIQSKAAAAVRRQRKR
ncbi:MAG TPA: TIGR03790 family protein [Opitutaceae bacterium]|nr:TIGR03790 family protein [Opitutaceae bacterium]